MSSLTLHYLSGYLQWSGSLVIILVVVFLLRDRSKDLSAIGIYAAASFLFQLLQLVSLYFFKSKYNNIVANIYFPIEVITLQSIYYFTFRDKRGPRIMVVAMAIVPLTLFIFKINDQFTSLNTNTETIRDFVMIVCALGYFFFLIRELPQENITKLPMFWINSAVLVYFSCTFMLSLSLDYLTEILKDDLIGYWTFRNFLRVAFCLIICVGLLRARKPAQA